MSQQNNMKNIEKNLTNMKNMLNVSLVDILIPDIKSHKNENVKKMLDVVKDKPEMYLSLLMVSIFHKNKEIVELILDKYFTSEIAEPYVNPQFLFNAILPENSKNKLTDPKNNYLEEICPYSVMAGIGGDVDIFQILCKKNLINNYNINNSGIIGLTKKYKNIFCSNIIGACSYYGNDQLLEFILNNYRQYLDININTIEKKSKNSKFHFSKEFSDFSPIFLGIVGISSDKKILSILKVLEEFRANFESKDFNENNIIHIATKEKKILSLKFLVESLGFKNIINEYNSNNETPYIIAQKMKNKEMIDFFGKYLKEGEDEDIIKKNMEELINEDNKRKNKKKNKKDKNKKNIFHMLNSNEYEETLVSQEEKLEAKKDEENNSNELNEKNEDNFSDKEEEKENEEENEEIEEKNNNYDNKRNNEYYSYKDKKKKNKYNYKDNKKYENYNNNNDNKAYNNYDKYTYNTYDKYNQYNNKNYYNDNYKYKNNNKNYENNYDYNNNYYNDYYYEPNNNWENKKRKKGKFNNKENKNKKDLYQKEFKGKGLAIEINIEGDKNINKEDVNNNEGKKDKNIEIENEIQKNNEEINNNNQNISTNINNNNENNITIKEKEEEKNNSEEEEEEYSYSEEDFLSHHSEKKEEKDEEKKIEIIKYNELLKKYIEIERRVNELEKEKKELNKCIKKIYLAQYKNKQNIPSNEPNINSLMVLTNNELEKKDKLIVKLKSEAKMADLSDIKNFEKEKLKEYKNFYNKNLKIINDTLKKNEK